VVRAEDAIDQQYNFYKDQLQYLQNNYIYMDHDQTYALSFGGYYKPLKNTTIYTDNIYGVLGFLLPDQRRDNLGFVFKSFWTYTNKPLCGKLI